MILGFNGGFYKAFGTSLVAAAPSIGAYSSAFSTAYDV